jgi:hypothetical protein
MLWKATLWLIHCQQSRSALPLMADIPDQARSQRDRVWLAELEAESRGLVTPMGLLSRWKAQ